MNDRSRFALVIVAVIVLAGIYFNLPDETGISLIVVGSILLAILGAVFAVLRTKRP